MALPRQKLPRWTAHGAASRPRELDFTAADAVCDRVANGETLAEICQDLSMPLPATFLRWCREDGALAQRYLQAQEDQCEVMLDELTVLAQHPDARVAKNELEARRILLEKKLPRKYGPRSYMNVTPTAEETPGGADAAEVRRRLEAMAKNAAAQAESAG